MALTLHPDRFFPPDPAERAAARSVYEETAALPIVSPHGHVAPALLADDRPFPEPTGLLITPDHYVFRMLHSQGVDLDALGIPRADGSRAQVDPREVWRLFCAHWPLFAGTPTRAWLEYELHELFGVREAPSPEAADRIYEHVAERLASPEYRPRALFERFGIEVLATTDAATDTLGHHRALAADGWGGRVIPTFRPDALVRVARPPWRREVGRLGALVGGPVRDYEAFAAALRQRRDAFRALGAVATDHGAETAAAGWLPEAERDALFARALAGEATEADEAAFTAHMLMAFAEMSAEDGLVMQLHVGALRDHDVPLAARFGPDKGADVPLATEFTRALRPLLSTFGSAPGFRLIAFTLDESTYARELAPLAGHYPGLVLGPAWWFHDSVEGMLRYRERTTETAGFYNTAGFNDDTRAFCSIPARHDLARRIDAHYLGRLVARHQLSLAEARRIGADLAYHLPRRAYRLDGRDTSAPAADGPALRLGGDAMTRPLVALVALALAGCAPPPEADRARVLRLGHGLSTDHPVHRAMLAMAAHVDSASGGRLRVAVYPSGQLGSERECLELLQIGSLALTKVSASVLEGFAPEFAVFSLPYLFRDEAHRLASFHSDVGRDLLDATEAYRFRGLTYYDAGARSYYTVERPVLSPDDLRGLKIRVQESPTSIRMVREMGGSPTPISWGELYTALQQGVVDGAENNPPSFYLSRHYEVAPYYVLNEHTAVPDVLVVGTPVWDTLSEPERAWLTEAAEASAALEERLWRAATEEALAAVAAAGVEVVPLGPEGRAAFSETVADMLLDVDPETRRLIERIQAIGTVPGADP